MASRESDNSHGFSEDEDNMNDLASERYYEAQFQQRTKGEQANSHDEVTQDAKHKMNANHTEPNCNGVDYKAANPEKAKHDDSEETNPNQEEIVHIQNNKKAVARCVTQQKLKIEPLLNDYENLAEVQKKMEKYNEDFTSYCSQHEKLLLLMQEKDELRAEVKQHEELDTEYFHFMKQVMDWVYVAETAVSKQSIVADKETSNCALKAPPAKQCSLARRAESIKSSSNSITSSVCLLLEERMLYEELLIDQKFLHQKRELEASERATQYKKEELELNIKIEKSKARLNAIRDVTSNERSDSPQRSPSTHHSQSTTKSNKKSPKNNHSNSNTSDQSTHHKQIATHVHTMERTGITESVLQAQLETILNSQKLMRLPSPQVRKFSGDPVTYHNFMRSFDTQIVPFTSSPSDLLYYLDQHLEGEAKIIIKGCMMMKPEDGYVKARECLKKEYDNSIIISNAYVRKLMEWQSIKADDGKSLKSFSMFLNECFQTMSAHQELTIINHTPYMQTIIKKLPMCMQNKWLDYASDMRRTENRLPTFMDLCAFMENASDTANDPVYSKAALYGLANIKQQRTAVCSSFATRIEQLNEMNTCAVCNDNHDIEECNAFQKQNLHDRRKFVLERKLCFSCYNLGHVAKNCTARRTCSICNRKHPTLLHDHQRCSEVYTNSTAFCEGPSRRYH